MRDSVSIPRPCSILACFLCLKFLTFAHSLQVKAANSGISVKGIASMLGGKWCHSGALSDAQKDVRARGIGIPCCILLLMPLQAYKKKADALKNLLPCLDLLLLRETPCPACAPGNIESF